MYFSMKKQKRAAAATKQMHESLVPGARVMTTSGPARHGHRDRR